MRAAIYARVSTDKQGTENQLVQLREFAARQGWQITREYVDCESGSKSNRAEFQQMFEDASRRKFDLLLFWSLDRLTREGALKTLQYLNQLTSWSVGFRSYTEAYLDSCGMFRDAVIAILGCIAAQEKARISERTRAGLATARRNGKHLGRPRVTVDAACVARLRAAGASWAAICRATGLSKGTAQRAFRSLPKKVAPSRAVSADISAAN